MGIASSLQYNLLRIKDEMTEAVQLQTLHA